MPASVVPKEERFPSRASPSPHFNLPPETSQFPLPHWEGHSAILICWSVLHWWCTLDASQRCGLGGCWERAASPEVIQSASLLHSKRKLNGERAELHARGLYLHYLRRLKFEACQGVVVRLSPDMGWGEGGTHVRGLNYFQTQIFPSQFRPRPTPAHFFNTFCSLGAVVAK